MSGGETRSPMSWLHSSKTSNNKDSEERTPSLQRDILGLMADDEPTQTNPCRQFGQTVDLEGRLPTAKPSQEVSSELSSNVSSKKQPDEYEISPGETLNLKTEENDEDRPSKKKLAGNDTNIIQPPKMATKLVPRPQKRQKDKNSALSKKLAAKGGPVGDDRLVKGEFRRVCAGYGMFKDQKNPIEQKAAYHCDLRRELIDLDSAENEVYNEEPAHGRHADDITSQCSFQKSWTSDRNTVVDRQGNKVLLMDQPPEGFIAQRPDGNMIYHDQVHGDLVVINQNNHPVRNFADVPRTLSSEIEAWRLEALLRTTSMTIYDVRSRMPCDCENENGSRSVLQGNSAFTNRTGRWRKKFSLRAWRGNFRKRVEGETKQDIKGEFDIERGILGPANGVVCDPLQSSERPRPKRGRPRKRKAVTEEPENDNLKRKQLHLGSGLQDEETGEIVERSLLLQGSSAQQPENLLPAKVPHFVPYQVTTAYPFGSSQPTNLTAGPFYPNQRGWSQTSSSFPSIGFCTVPQHNAKGPPSPFSTPTSSLSRRNLQRSELNPSLLGVGAQDHHDQGVDGSSERYQLQTPPEQKSGTPRRYGHVAEYSPVLGNYHSGMLVDNHTGKNSSSGFGIAWEQNFDPFHPRLVHDEFLYRAAEHIHCQPTSNIESHGIKLAHFPGYIDQQRTPHLMDMRGYVPATGAEADEIELALSPTIDNFRRLNPDAELVFGRFDSYHTSYNRLQAITNATAQSNGIQPRVLLGYGPWYGDLGDWWSSKPLMEL